MQAEVVVMEEPENKPAWSCALWDADHLWTSCDECQAGYYRHCGDEHDEWKVGGEDD